MLSPFVTLSPFLSLLLATKVEAATCPTTTCHTLHLFLARGNNEPYPGRQSALISAVCSGLPSNTTCGYEDLVYSALYTDLSCQTTYSGAIAGHLQMTKYAEACPESKLVLAGYSQGAQIVMDILGGGGGVSFNGCVQPETPGLDKGTKPGSMVAAALVFGNTRHTASQAYNFGNGSALDGLFPRPASQLTALGAYADVLRDWCVSTDPICAAHQSDSQVAAHLGYYNTYPAAAGSWVRSVASLTLAASGSGVTTTVPGSLSGTAQDYATIGTATPSGTVTLDTTWTEQTSIVSCTLGSSSVSAVSTPASSTASSSASSVASSTVGLSTSSSISSTSSTSSRTSSHVTSTIGSLASQTTSVASSTSSAVAGAFDASIFQISIVVVVLACM